ncbi:uncharacterized protein LOC122692567 isoform X2 [Cervus elaphus]|uniref:uncharacterized protein LOC122692567 isoform X2 n=1 Tax=Cervus elaphus TaxID=9860 RepID=UPI001CC2EEB7|nr:uncharacterized protein LOC122692567 isoform X2 [Cervus elaphus]
MLALRGGRSRARAAGSAGQPCWAGCARGRCGPGIAMAPSVPLLLGLVFCRDPGIWAQTDLPEVYQNPLEETALPVVSGSSAIGLLPLLFVLLFILCLCCCGGQHGSADNETKSQLDFNSSNPGMDFSEENPRKRSEEMTSRCTSCWRRTDRRTCTPTPRNAHGGLLSPPLSRTRTPSRRVSFHCRLAALKSPQYSPTWTHLPLIWSAERELAVCTPWRKCPLRSVGFHGVSCSHAHSSRHLVCKWILLPLRHLGSPRPHFGAPRRLKNTEALSVLKKFWDMRDGIFPAVSVNKGYHSHKQ